MKRLHITVSVATHQLPAMISLPPRRRRSSDLSSINSIPSAASGDVHVLLVRFDFWMQWNSTAEFLQVNLFSRRRDCTWLMIWCICDTGHFFCYAGCAFGSSHISVQADPCNAAYWFQHCAYYICGQCPDCKQETFPFFGDEIVGAKCEPREGASAR